MRVTIVPDEVFAALIAEFGSDPSAVAERALRGEITRHRISVAVKAGTDPAAATAEALDRDPHFLGETDTIAEQIQLASGLHERLRRWG